MIRIKTVSVISELFPKKDKNYRYSEDIQWKREAVDLLDVLNAVSEALNLFQKGTTTISEATQIWEQLLGNKCPGSFKELSVKRMNDALSPALLAANLLDHRFQGALLTPSETETGIEYIHQRQPEIMSDVMKFLAKKSFRVKSIFISYNSSPTSWWKLGSRLGFPDGIVQYSFTLLSGICSSA